MKALFLCAAVDASAQEFGVRPAFGKTDDLHIAEDRTRMIPSELDVMTSAITSDLLVLDRGISSLAEFFSHK